VPQIRTLLTIRWRSAKALAGEFLITLRIINDPLQIYLAVTCWYKVLSGNVQPRKIWSKLPRQGEPQQEDTAAAKVKAGRSPRHLVDDESVSAQPGADDVVEGAVSGVVR
jgi:hypothetical protein